MNLKSSIECLGLPATGKSWVVENKKVKDIGDTYTIKLGMSFSKLFYVIIGIVLHKHIIKTLFQVYKLNKKSISTKTFIKRVLVCFHRLGLLKSYEAKGIFLDEGPIQSIWAIFYSLPVSKENQFYLKSLLFSTTISDRILYVSTPRKLHLKRMNLRERKHEIINKNIYSLSRKWLFLILIELRKKPIKIQYYCNT